jgi:hypothetical protein
VTAWCAPLELRDLASRYAYAVDRRDPDLLLPLFTADGGVMGHGPNPIAYRGDARLRQMLIDVGTFQLTMHKVFNQVFDRGDDGTVTGVTYCVASHILPGEDWATMDMAILYHDRYAADAGCWRFAERRLEVLWVETRPVSQFTAEMMNQNLSAFQ